MCVCVGGGARLRHALSRLAVLFYQFTLNKMKTHMHTHTHAPACHALENTDGVGGIGIGSISGRGLTGRI